MNLYTLTVALHVIVAILGTGQVAAIAIVSGVARRRKFAPDAVASLIGPLLFGLRISLATMLVTGIALNFVAGNTYHVYWWFRLSGLLLFMAFFFQARARTAITKLGANDGEAARAIRRIERSSWSMSAIVLVIAFLMQQKPF